MIAIIIDYGLVFNIKAIMNRKIRKFYFILFKSERKAI